MRPAILAALSLGAVVMVGCSSDRGDERRAQPAAVVVATEFGEYRVRNLERACEAGIMADLDGDGLGDRANHTNLSSGSTRNAVLTVCLGTGRVLAVDGIGMAEGPFQAIDSNADGLAELVYGGTSVCAAGGGVAVVDDNELVVVHMADGSPLTVDEGCAGPPEGRADAWGCDEHDLVRVTAEPDDAGRTAWTRQHVRIAGRTAQVVETESGVSTARRPNVLAVPDDLTPESCDQIAGE